MTLVQYDIPELKELALKWIQSTIHSRDIMRELASDFTTVYRFRLFAPVLRLTKKRNQFPGDKGDLSAAACKRVVFGCQGEHVQEFDVHYSSLHPRRL